MLGTVSLQRHKLGAVAPHAVQVGEDSLAGECTPQGPQGAGSPCTLVLCAPRARFPSHELAQVCHPALCVTGNVSQEVDGRVFSTACQPLKYSVCFGSMRKRQGLGESGGRVPQGWGGIGWGGHWGLECRTLGVRPSVLTNCLPLESGPLRSAFAVWRGGPVVGRHGPGVTGRQGEQTQCEATLRGASQQLVWLWR